MEGPPNLPRVLCQDVDVRHVGIVDSTEVKAGHGVPGASRVRATSVTGGICSEVEGAALISSAMDTHAFERLFHTGADGVLALDPGEDVVDCPGSAGGQIVDRIGGRVVSQLRVAAAKRHFGLIGGIGHTWHCGQTGLAVERVVALVAAQVAEGGVIGHEAGEIVLPVEALDGCILRVCRSRGRKSNGKVGLRVDTAELPPEGVVEVIRLADVHVDAKEIYVLAVGQRSLAGLGNEVIVDFLAIGRVGQFRKKDFGDRIFEVGVDLVVREWVGPPEPHT